MVDRLLLALTALAIIALLLPLPPFCDSSTRSTELALIRVKVVASLFLAVMVIRWVIFGF